MVWRKRGGMKKAGRRRFARKSKYTKGGSGRVLALKTLTVPDKLIVKLPYSTMITFGDALGAQTQIFNLNSIYDPDRSGVGHQPLGYDQWAAFYNRYRVIGVKVTVQAANYNQQCGATVAIIGNNSAGLVLGSDAIQEQQHMRRMILSNAQGGKNSGTLTKYFSLSRITGVSDMTYRSSDQYAAQFGASPAEVICGHVYWENLLALGGQASSGVSRINVVYYVELFDRNTLALSDTNPEARGPENNNDKENTFPTVA